MLPKRYRLMNKADFDVVFSQGKRRSGEFLVVLVLEKPGLANVLLGVIVSSKVSKRAVDRNRIRRVVQGALREIVLGSKEFYMVVVVAKKRAISAPREKLGGEAVALLKKLIQPVSKHTY